MHQVGKGEPAYFKNEEWVQSTENEVRTCRYVVNIRLLLKGSTN